MWCQQNILYTSIRIQERSVTIEFDIRVRKCTLQNIILDCPIFCYAFCFYNLDVLVTFHHISKFLAHLQCFHFRTYSIHKKSKIIKISYSHITFLLDIFMWCDTSYYLGWWFRSYARTHVAIICSSPEHAFDSCRITKCWKCRAAILTLYTSIPSPRERGSINRMCCFWWQVFVMMTNLDFIPAKASCRHQITCSSANLLKLLILFFIKICLL